MHLAFEAGTQNCNKYIPCDECENQCKTRKQYEKSCSVIEQLIKEHFNNLPLKFEELKPDMWIWDNLENEYIRVDTIYDNSSFSAWRIAYDYDNDYKFQKNRFYRKQVK